MLKVRRLGLTLLILALVPAGLMQTTAVASANPGGPRSLGTIAGTVVDHRGKPLIGALVTFLRDGAGEVVREVRTGADGRFSVRLAAGRYSLRAMAAGFNAAAFDSVQITPSAELIYRFNLEPAGAGRTAPEKRADRNETKWRLRAAQSRRSIFQVDEHEDRTVASVEAAEAAPAATISEVAAETAEQHGGAGRRRPQGVVETYGVASANAFARGYAGLNFAVAEPVSERFDLILAGQFGFGSEAPQRLETTASFRLNDRHRVSLRGGAARLGGAAVALGGLENLGQLSLGALDEWTVRDGVIVVLGMDYSRFTGASDQDSLSPRLGLQYDLDARTRLRAAYAPGGGGETVQSVAQFEDNQIVFREAREQTVAFAHGRPLLEKSRRLEFGLERVLDDRSSVEATAFFDTTDGRGVGLLSTPLSAFSGEAGEEMLQVAQQQGAARGLRVLYARRLGAGLSASAGYSFGRGQKLLASGITEPDKLWGHGFFQTMAAQVDARLSSGTRVRTVFRFSPRAMVFAIDPFAGRLAVFDPSLSVYVTQELPTFGLPLRVEAILDARNILDAQSGAVDDGETITAVGAMRRSVRGGISVRF